MCWNLHVLPYGQAPAFLLYRMQWAGGGRFAGGGSMRLGSCLRGACWSKGREVVAAWVAT